VKLAWQAHAGMAFGVPLKPHCCEGSPHLWLHCAAVFGTVTSHSVGMHGEPFWFGLMGMHGEPFWFGLMGMRGTLHEWELVP
jgi:hypothetical protein